MGAKLDLVDLYLFLDQVTKSELQNEANKNGTNWNWEIHLADSSQRNRAAEAAVQIVKRAFCNLAVNLANQRPIDARIQSREDSISYITPNSFLLGRAGPKGDIYIFNIEGYSTKSHSNKSG